MLKKLKKILPALLALALALTALAGCGGNYTSDKLGGDISGEVSSNGGFAVQKGEYVYFINGVGTQSADNTYGEVVKGSLQRISAADLAAGNYAETETVVPLLLTSQDYTSGVYIYGDTVYYATPNVIKNMEGEVDTSYLDFKSSKLDGSETMRDYYVQVDDSSTVYRYVQDENGTVYLLYVDSSETEIRSYNTETGENTVLAKGYSSYILPEETEGSTIYYTMSVTQKDTYSAASGAGTAYSYQQLYAVSAFETECPYTVDGKPFTESEEYLAAYTDKDADEDDDARVMEYINLGTLVLDGVGLNQQESTPFNHDWPAEGGIGGQAKSLGGFTYSFLKCGGGSLYLTVSKVAEGSAFVYRFDEAAYRQAVEADSWNSITANPTITGAETTAGTALTPVAISSGNATSSALYYLNEGEDEDAPVYIYVDSSGNIVRNTVDTTATDGTFDNTDLIGESVTLARAQTEATLLFLRGDYLYYTIAGDSGSGLYRIRYNGTADDYNILTSQSEDFRPTRYLQIEYSNSWYKPEVLTVGEAEYLLFANAGTYAGSYVYVMENPANNADLKTLNEKWEDVFDIITDLSEEFSAVSKAAEYYFYSADGELTTLLADEEEAYYENYTEEDLELIAAFVNPTTADAQTTLNAYRLDFKPLYGGDGEHAVFWNTESAYYNRLGTMDEDDEESLADSLKGAYLTATAEEDADGDAWTWQWAAIFVPVGVVVIAAAVLGAVLTKKRRYGVRK